MSDQVGTDYDHWRQSDGDSRQPDNAANKHQRPTITTTTTITSAAGRQAPQSPASSGTNWLLIEFTPSLLQLKEFNLKCKTIIEQPLSVVESSQILSLATSPFIQVVQDHSQQNTMQVRPTTAGANGGRHSSLFNVKEHPRKQQASMNGAPGQYQSSVGLNKYDYSNSGQQHRHRSNVIRMRQSSGFGSSSSGAVSMNNLPALRLGYLLVLLHFAALRHCYFFN